MIRFSLPITAVPKGRPRFTRDGRTFTPVKTRRYENTLRLLMNPYRPVKPLEGGLYVAIAFHLPRLKTKKRSHPTTGSDLDNLVKAVLDPMNKLFWRDDSQVISLWAKKVFTDDLPRIDIEVQSL